MYLSHGVGEYMGRYEKLGQELADSGILAFSHDHGKLVEINCPSPFYCLLCDVCSYKSVEVRRYIHA